MHAEPQYTGSSQFFAPSRASAVITGSRLEDRHDVIRLAVVLTGSVALHAVAALILAVLPAVSSVRIAPAEEVELDLLLSATRAPERPPILAPEPPPVAAPIEEPAPTPRVVERAPRPVEAAAPEPAPAEPPPPAVEPPVEAAPPPVVAAAPAEAAPAPMLSGLPSLDEAFGPIGPGAAGLGASNGRPGGTRGGTGAGTGVAVAAPGPSTDDVRRARRAYVRALEELLRAQARYPREARRDGHQGRVELALRVARDGRLLAVRVASSSGFDDLDDAALEAAERLTPPPPPDIVRWAAAEEVRAPVLYVLQ